MIHENLYPNLDGFATPEELDEIAIIFGYLEQYAVSKATAMRLRIDGNIKKAIAFENMCEYYYEKLPEWARW